MLYPAEDEGSTVSNSAPVKVLASKNKLSPARLLVHSSIRTHNVPK